MILVLLLLQLLGQPFSRPNADSLVITRWTTAEGLPGNSMNRVVQDSDGFIWMSSYFGLIRFDGIHFHVHDQSNTPEIRNNRLVFFHKGPDGSVWMSLEHLGLVRYKNQKFRLYESSDGLTEEHIGHLDSDQDGVLWVGSQDGLYRYDAAFDSFSRIDLGTDARTNQIQAITVGSSGVVWISTFNGWARVENGVARVYGSGEVDNIWLAGNGQVWIGARTGLVLANQDGIPLPVSAIPSLIRGLNVTSLNSLGSGSVLTSTRGVFHVQNDKVVRLVGERIEPDDFITQAFTDSYGVNWLVTMNGHLFIIRSNRLERLPITEPISKSSALAIYEDRERNLWFTTRYGGIFRIKRNLIGHIGRLEGIRGNNVLGLFVDRNSRLFIGTRNEGFSVVTSTSIINYPSVANPGFGGIHDFAQDSQGRIWIGAYQRGLIRFDERTGTLKSHYFGNSSMSRDIRGILPNNDGTLWLATSAGLVLFNTENESFEVLDRSTGLPSQMLRALIRDSDGRIWVSTADNGAFLFDPETRKSIHYHAQNGLPSNHIRTVFIDPDDRDVIWFGSETAGLIRYRKGEFASIGIAEGLPDKVVHSIQQGPLGWLWISTNSGVVRINKRDLNSYLDGKSLGFHFIIYNEEDGMRNKEANGGFQRGSLISPDKSRILISTQDGVVLIPLTKPDPNQEAPPVFIRHGIDFFRDSDIILKNGVKDIDIEFSGLRYAAPSGIRYQYRLVGKDTTWTDDFDRKPVRIRDLAPGKYVFEVISWNEAGTRSSDPAILRIHVKPLFWQTYWFVILMVSVLIVMVWGVVHIRTSRLSRLRERLETLVVQRTTDLRLEKAEVEKQKAIVTEQAEYLEEILHTREKFFSIIGHDLRGPFQTLIGLTQLMIDEYEEMDDHEIRQNLKHLRASSENLHRLVENLLEWSTLQRGHVPILIETLDINRVLESTVRLFGPSASVKGIHLEAIVPDGMVVNGDANILDTIIRNFVSNAIKFTKAEGIVVLEAGISESGWWVQVSDNGIGMSEEMRSNVLSVDRSIKRRGTVNEWGTGLGLALCNELISVYGGSITVESEVDVGSRFTVNFPNRS